MNKATLVRIFLAIFVVSFFLYRYTDQQNALTKLRLRLPALAKEIKAIREENKHLCYEIEQFESPEHLMQLARRGEFSHLKQPLLKDIYACPEGLALVLSSPEGKRDSLDKSKPTLAVGVSK
jgi:hypothetical protein